MNADSSLGSVPTAAERPLLSVVVPVFNEADGLEAFWQRLGEGLEQTPVEAEILLVNDGSTDRTLEVMRALQQRDLRITLLDLSRNFGKEIAMSAGFDHAAGDAVIVIDADLQDPPELIPQLVAEWRNGYDVVYARRVARDGETLLKRATAGMFYRVIQAVSRVKIPTDTGDFRLLSRRAVDALRSLKEQHRFMKGLFSWIGFPQKEVTYRRDPRFTGKSKWNYWRLWNFAIEGITSFTIAPLKAATYLGVLVAAAAFLFAGFIIYKTLVYGDPVKGYPSLMVVVLFLGGIQLIFIGILGEYLGRTFDEVKGRPLYLVNQYVPGSAVRQPPSVSGARLQEASVGLVHAETASAMSRAEGPRVRPASEAKP